MVEIFNMNLCLVGRFVDCFELSIFVLLELFGVGISFLNEIYLLMEYENLMESFLNNF